MIYQFLIHAENRSELHLGLVCNIVSTGLITTERDGYIGERCGVSPPVGLRLVLGDDFRTKWR